MTIVFRALAFAFIFLLSVAPPCVMRASAAAPAADSSEQDATELGMITVIAVTPEQGANLPEMRVPYNVQSATSEQFERAQVLDVTDYLNRRSAGITINSVQGNPLQPDVQFRGFSASPLLGGSEGISVYVDGVRVNEIFGDTVNWDLIPEEAMAKMSLLAGANPVFGINTLGGAILIQTKNGFSDPGTQAEIYSGSFGRNETTVQSGGNAGQWGYYAIANHFEEAGWRDLSNSNAGSFLSTLSWRGDEANLDLHLAHAQTKLTGNGAQSIQVLALAPQSVFTAPDRTQNFYSAISGQGTYKFGDDTLLTATLFDRQVNTRSYNGDLTDFQVCNNDAARLCTNEGSPVRDQNGDAVTSAYNTINNIGVRKQRSYGGSLQAVFKQPLWAMSNQLVAGVDYDRGRVNYGAVLEASYLVPFSSDPASSFFTASSGIFVPDDALRVHIADANEGLYLTDTLSLSDSLAITLSGRYNRTRIVIADTGGGNPDLDGAHAFHRFNPAAGLTYQIRPAINFYASYAESTRAPTPVELTCASPDAPCRLPNDFVADPDLHQVVAKHIESGLRGNLNTPWTSKLHWQAGVFRTTNQKDILFQATGGAQSNQGFYANVGNTRRQGMEASLNGSACDDRLNWYASYTHLDATFRSAFVESSANDPYADAATGLIQVHKGDRIPGLPRQALKLGADYKITTGLTVGGDVVYNSARYLRGDESNQIGPLGGYAVANLRASYRVSGHVAVFARVENLFDRRYYSFGVLGNATAIYPAFTDPRFLSTGPPRGAWIGVSVDL
jgi:outer membrane receptor protein involved in Fe transport